MAREIGINRPGGLEVLEVIDRSVREPAKGEVRIAVRAAAVNPTDIGLRQRGGGDTVIPRSDDFARGVRDVVGEGAAAVYDTALLNRAAFGAIRMAADWPSCAAWQQQAPRPGGHIRR
jgi:hypothetical protein